MYQATFAALDITIAWAMGTVTADDLLLLISA